MRMSKLVQIINQRKTFKRAEKIKQKESCLAYAYTENAIVGHTDSIIALTIFDLMAPSFGLGACWAGLLHRAAVEYQPLKEAIGIPDCILQYPILFGYPKYKYML